MGTKYNPFLYGIFLFLFFEVFKHKAPFDTANCKALAKQFHPELIDFLLH